jgi:uracil-DNA glycosylase
MFQLPKSKTFVPPSGRPDSPYVFVGEQPGKIEVRERRVFVGPAGKEFTSDLSIADIGRPLCYITNVIKDLDYHKDNYIKLYNGTRLLQDPIISSRGQEYIDFLKWEIEQTSAKYIGAIGAIAMYALTGRIGITNWRGSLLDSTLVEGRKVIPILHPATVIAPKFQYLNKRLIIFDLKRLKMYQSGLIVPTERKITTKPTFTQVIEFLSYCEQKGLEGGRISYDIEIFMNRVHKQVSCISFATNRCAMCIPFTDSNGDYFILRQEIYIWKKIAELLENPLIRICGQNLTFDCHFLLRTYGIRVSNLDDTMIAQNTMMPDYPKGLDFITSLWTDHPYYKADGKAFFKGSGLYQKFWIYNATDSLICDEAISKQMSEVERIHNVDIYKAQTKLIEPLIYMMEHGIKVNVRKMEDSNREYERTINSCQKELNELAGESLNANSPKQLKEYFYFKKGIKPFTKNHKVTYNDDVMKRLIRKGHKEAKLIQQIRRYTKLRSTYLDLGKVDNDGRLRCSYNPVGTRYSRLSSSKNIFGSGCLKPEAEVLTPSGWVMFKNFKDGMQVAQWAPSGEISWTIPRLLKYSNDSRYVIRANSNTHRNYYTMFHRIPKLTKEGNFSVEYANNIFMKSNWFLPLSGIFSEGIGCKLSVRVLAMIQADGSIERNGIRLTFKKQRKINRCLRLLITANISFTEHHRDSGYRRFYIRVQDAKPYIDFLGPNKLLSHKLLNLSQKQMYEFIEEIGYWDAHIRNRSCQYYSAIKQNVEWVATIAHLIGYSATFSTTENNRHKNSYGSDTILWVANIKPRYKAYQKSDMYSIEKYSGPVYCLQTLTSFFLCRYQDRICITGNSNLQNWVHELQELLIPDDGYVYYAFDLSQAENRIVAYVGEVINMIECFETEKDVHSRTARMIMKVYYQLKDLGQHNVLDISPLGDGTHDWRFWGKKSNHCYLSDTHVLSKKGWIPIKEAAYEYCDIACFSKNNNKITFEVPSNWTVDDYSGDIISFKGKYLSQRVTPNHRIPYRERGSNINSDIKWETAKRKRLISSNEWLTSGTYENGNINIPPLYIRLMIAFQADGGWDWKAPIWHLRNPVKIKRLKIILELLKVEYTK